jgi:RNA polymerase sigma-70 factor (ECF subfamily)
VRTLQPDREGRFRALYADAYLDVLRFVQRRVHPSHAEDVVADAFLVAWRRLEEAPRSADDARAWLFGIARRCLLNTQRGLGRQEALAVRIAGAASTDDSHRDDAVVQRLALATAWQRLSPQEQETLSLSVFEDLTSARAARVLGTSAAAYRLRLLRARRALRRQLALLEQPAAIPAVRRPAASPATPTRMETHR